MFELVQGRSLNPKMHEKLRTNRPIAVKRSCEDPLQGKERGKCLTAVDGFIFLILSCLSQPNRL